MNFGLVAAPLLILLSLVSSCSAELERTRGEAMVTLEITEIEPEPPLDPYRPVTVHYKLTNGTSRALSIPDLNQLELEIGHESGTPKHNRTLSLPLSLTSIQQRARAKVPQPKPHPVSVEPNAVRTGTFPTLDAWPPLPEGPASAVLRLPLAQGDTLQSQARQFEVTRVLPAYEQELAHGTAALTDVPIRQKLVLVAQNGNTRLLLLSTIYPDFLSVIADCVLPLQTNSVRLLRYWPQNLVHPMVAEVDQQDVLVFTADREGLSPATELTLRDRLQLPDGFGLLGLVFVGRDENGIGIEDYLLIARGSVQDSAVVIGEYWRRNTSESTWSRAEIGRWAVKAGAAEPNLRLQEDGFAVHIGSDTPACAFLLTTKLAEYRGLASEDKHPLKIMPQRR
jgi:hypothetical protein